ncbi:Dimer Tnp hAT domain-containing protein [Aphis craccivora]|uniref:Dimer Tnp hAT domain-containing protein n=1 Tax=Aphis craccivora TaxID=307492 RepID=A0A6G0ZD12_APHCR|nr:Dimer Tnp hAT domain-containing protein [Aphis craccivora]
MDRNASRRRTEFSTIPIFRQHRYFNTNIVMVFGLVDNLKRVNEIHPQSVSTFNISIFKLSRNINALLAQRYKYIHRRSRSCITSRRYSTRNHPLLFEFLITITESPKKILEPTNFGRRKHKKFTVIFINTNLEKLVECLMCVPVSTAIIKHSFNTLQSYVKISTEGSSELNRDTANEYGPILTKVTLI